MSELPIRASVTVTLVRKTIVDRIETMKSIVTLPFIISRILMTFVSFLAHEVEDRSLLDAKRACL